MFYLQEDRQRLLILILTLLKKIQKKPKTFLRKPSVEGKFPISAVLNFICRLKNYLPF
jgi:hypothetical protein